MSYLSGIGLKACHADIRVGISRGEAGRAFCSREHAGSKAGMAESLRYAAFSSVS
jgi:hypothetical protein